MITVNAKYINQNNPFLVDYNTIYIDETGIEGYDATKAQTLKHEANGNVKWVDDSTDDE